MTIDTFTAATLLNAAINGADHDQLNKLHKSLQNENDAPSQELIDYVNSIVNRKCKIKATSHKGIIVRANLSTCGFYPGGRYPAYVRITESGMEKAIGNTYEYSLDQIELIDEETSSV